MSRVLHVAWRDFKATAMTRAFILGAFVVPVVLMGVVFVGFKYVFKKEAPAIEGTLSVIDHSGQVLEPIAEWLRPEAIAARNRTMAGEVADEIEERMGSAGPRVGAAVKSGLEAQNAKVPRITVVPLPLDADVDAEKRPLRQPEAGTGARLALAVIDAHAVIKPEERDHYGGFELFVRAKLDERVESEIRSAIRESIKDKRIRAAALDPEALNALIHVEAPRTREVSAEGERDSLGEARLFVSFGFMAILMISVMLGGQYLLTTTVEEKSSRVVEVLLSALSPMELMGGKILGQLGVGLSILIIYGSLGGGALFLFGLGYLLGPVNLMYLIVFFLIAYFTIGALMAAVGSAVNELREAQSLQTPVMLIMMIPYLLWMPLSSDPNGVFATVCSFIPPVNAFVMILRVTSTEPPPTWQVLLSIAVGLLGVYAAMWAAAKVFHIGLLMFGKPPNFGTLLRWIRMA